MVIVPVFLTGPPESLLVDDVCPDEHPAMTVATDATRAIVPAAALRRENCIVLTLLPGGWLLNERWRVRRRRSSPVAGSLGRPSWGGVNKKSIVFTYLISPGSLPETPLRYLSDAG